jgi:hypothetical protein
VWWHLLEATRTWIWSEHASWPVATQPTLGCVVAYLAPKVRAIEHLGAFSGPGAAAIVASVGWRDRLNPRVGPSQP